ncbi:MAG: translation initiation factor IF-3 [Candidatus Vogelbacteria bacterium]|nr:translation initiation factor IF-3 [Candidatus Vogelbacteria bacterium]
MKDYTRVNNQIRASEVRVIDEDGQNLGVMQTADAVSLAHQKGSDLIEISPNAVPPIAKIMDYGKFQYLENKKAKVAKSKTKPTETKSIQVKIGTGDHDLELKSQMASKFLKAGHRVKINLFLRGRAKYMPPDFLKERMQRILKFITEEYKMVESPKPGPSGLSLVIEKVKK